MLIEAGGGGRKNRLFNFIFSAPTFYFARRAAKFYTERLRLEVKSLLFTTTLCCGQKRYSFVINFIEKSGTRCVEFQL